MGERKICGNYYLLGRLASGGMAEVFLAKACVPGPEKTLLALKRVLPEFSKDPNFVTMLADEARIASGLHHPNICEIYEQGEHDGQLFIVMEFIHGKDLLVIRHRAEQRGEKIPYAIAACLMTQIAEALDFAHQKTTIDQRPAGIVHRDVSPHNVLLAYQGTPKLIDFGIAKADYRLSQTQAGRIKGKFAYMSPEQARGETLDRRTDIFSLGIILYELLTGATPFPAENNLGTLRRIAEGDGIEITARNPDLPRPLVQVVNRALRHHRNERYERAADMASDLRLFWQGTLEGTGQAALSAYLRRLFREEYIRESHRIRSLVAIEPPPPHELHLYDSSSPEDQTRIVEPSFFLAAGYEPGAATAHNTAPIDVPQASTLTPANSHPIEEPSSPAHFLTPLLEEPVPEDHRASCSVSNAIALPTLAAESDLDVAALAQILPVHWPSDHPELAEEALASTSRRAKSLQPPNHQHAPPPVALGDEEVTAPALRKAAAAAAHSRQPHRQPQEGLRPRRHILLAFIGSMLLAMLAGGAYWLTLSRAPGNASKPVLPTAAVER